MRKVKLFEYTVAGTQQKVAQSLLQLLGNSPEDSRQDKGFSVDTIRKRARVSDLIEKASEAGQDHVMLPDPDWSTLRNVVEKTGYTTADKGILQLIDAVLDAEKVPE